MADNQLPHNPCESMEYQIRLKGHLGAQWGDWFGGMTIALEDDGTTILCGPVIDQAALHGLLKKTRDLGLPLLSVICIEPGRTNTAEYNKQAENKNE